jgi:thiosulfate/3-mercaptopyruvate sulfurtransferase
MSYPHPDALVETEWLEENLSDPNLRVLDGTTFIPGTPRDAKAEFAAEHIPGAVFFDIDAFKDESNPLPHMLPSETEFSAKIRKLGIGDGNRIVVYDRLGFFSAPRVWWTFRVFGHENIAVLNGGMPKWLAEGRPVTSEIVTPQSGHFTARFQPDLVRDFDQVRHIVEHGGPRIVDGRPRDRFEGTTPEPRAGLKSGHIPGSTCLMPSELLDPDTKAVLPVEQLRQQFDRVGVGDVKDMVTSCGSGVAASAVSLAGYLLTGEIAPVYDGSWSEWGGRDDAPVETGRARP